MNKNLFDDSDDNIEDNDFNLKTNQDYAKSYNHLRKKELLQKFKDKGLEASETDSDDTDSSEEDEILDPSFDQDFLKTLASLKSKDPTIYDKNIKFFKNQNLDSGEDSEDDDGGGGSGNRKKEKKAKPVTLKDYERKLILENEGKFVDDSDEDYDEDKEEHYNNRSLSPTLVEEERRLKAEFKKVVYDSDDSGDEDFGGIFKKREKSKAEKDKEEEDYLKWLAGKQETIEDGVKETLEPLKNYWSNDKLPSSEKFLRDYILNKGYTEATNYNEIPTYEEIVEDYAPLSEDEQELEKQAEFEEKYNFRYEEPDQEFIKRYPRTIESSVRLTDDKRKQKRQEVKERKEQEKQQKMKELEMVKEIKRKEIQEKIEKLKMVTGNDELGFKDDDLEEDFDPEAHDRRMQELFNDDYYEVDEGEEKPECPSDIDELKLEDWDNYDPHQEGRAGGEDDYEPHCEDEDFVMDCDYDPAKAKEELQKELIENTRKRKGRKGRRDRFMEIIKADKPVFDPQDEKTYGEYIDEYYKLDCEDIIGDTPCRFKYVETTPNDFGLTIEEILLAKNKELNQWASLKKAIQIRPEQVEKKEQRLYKLKSKNEDLKRKIFKSLYGEGSDNEEEELEQTQETETKPETAMESKNDNNNENAGQGESKKAKKKRKRKGQNAAQTALTTEEGKDLANTVNNLNEEEIPNKKPKTEEISQPEQMPIGDASLSGAQLNNQQQEVNKKKKKKKNKKKSLNSNAATNDNTTNKATTAINKTNENAGNKPINKTNPPTTHTKVKQNNNGDKNPFANNKTTGPNKPFNKNKNFNNNSLNDKKSFKNNPFASKFNKTADQPLGSLPPLRKNTPKTNFVNNQFKPKFNGNNKRPFQGGKSSTAKGDGKDNISDERLKAYGINPKKFHKKQKYGTGSKSDDVSGSKKPQN